MGAEVNGSFRDGGRYPGRFEGFVREGLSGTRKRGT
jgi:hypothetical protein